MVKGRASWDEYFMAIAKQVATRSTCDRKHIGAVIVKARAILSTGYNGSIAGTPHCDEVGHMMENDHCVRTIHAEANAIIQAARNGVALNGSALYLTASPCWNCFKLISNSGIKKVVYGEFYRDERIFKVARQIGIEMVEMGVGTKPNIFEAQTPLEIFAEIKIKKFFPDVIIPDYAHPGDAGLDIYSREDYILKPAERHIFSLGFAIEIPDGFVGLIWDRSGLAAKHGLTSFAGVLDSSYRGELKIVLYNSSSQPFSIKKGDKIAQLLIQPIARAKVEEAVSLSETERAQKGLGSTDTEVKTKYQEHQKRW